jgi:hypothetical protein
VSNNANLMESEANRFGLMIKGGIILLLEIAFVLTGLPNAFYHVWGPF